MAGCDNQQSLIPFESALSLLLETSETSLIVERVPLEAAVGRILAESPVAKVAVPPADNSGMDGYAVNTADLSSVAPTQLPVSQRIPAGTAPMGLVSGSCARIFTGAEIPEGADAVVMQEDVELLENDVLFPAAIRAGANIRRAGQDIKSGSQLFALGVRLQPTDLGVLASAGLAKVSVYRRLKVAIMSTGDELVEPGNALSAGKIYNSNRYILQGLLRKLGMDVIDMGRVEDSAVATQEALRRAAETSDVIVSTGGVSVGEEDHVKSSAEALGSLKLWRVAIKPGKPVAYGEVLGTPFIGLPGNPASTLVTFCLLARPFLMKLQGAEYKPPLKLTVAAGFSRSRAIKRQEYLRVRVESDRLVPYENQSSGVLSSASWADGLAVIPPGIVVSEGDPLGFIPFSELLG